MFLMLVLSAINNFFYEKLEESDSGFLTGYYLGTFLGCILFSWLLYKFYRLGSKLIKKSKNKTQIHVIGEQ